jgi:hypothetical protein
MLFTATAHSQQALPPLYLGEPPGNPGTLVKHTDGAIHYYYREGSWDDGFSSIVTFIATRDNGRSWSEPAPLVDTGPHSRAQNFLTMSPVTGEITLFYYDEESWKHVSGSTATSVAP